MLFDKHILNHMPLEINPDMSIMPLGKLSQAQLEKAKKVLKHISQLIKTKSPDQRALVDASSQFYALVPHADGSKNLPIIDSKELLQKK